MDGVEEGNIGDMVVMALLQMRKYLYRCAYGVTLAYLTHLLISSRLVAATMYKMRLSL